MAGTGKRIVVPTRDPHASAPAEHDPILVCAPSNAAVDEVVRRLIKGIPVYSGKIINPNVVRIGSLDTMHEDVHQVSMEKLVEAKVKGKQGHESKHANEISLLHAEVIFFYSLFLFLCGARKRELPDLHGYCSCESLIRKSNRYSVCVFKFNRQLI
jgi:hypothetical protein